MTPIIHDKHGLKLRLHRTRHGLAADPTRLSSFQRIADKVSYGMGTPANIAIWVIAVAVWIALGPYFANHDFLPAWFTSTGFNFPLNTVTTIAELYIGFLVGASSNRSERNLELTLGRIEQVEAGISGVLGAVKNLLESTAGVVTAIRDLVAKTHGMQEQQMSMLAGIAHANAELNIIRQAIAPAASNPAAGTDPAAPQTPAPATGPASRARHAAKTPKEM